MQNYGYEVMSIKTLVAKTQVRMNRLGYAEATRKNYTRIWGCFLCFCEEKSISHFSLAIGEAFLNYRGFSLHAVQRNNNYVRAILYLDDMCSNGSIARHHGESSKKIHPPVQYQEDVLLYTKFQHSKCANPNTIKTRLGRLNIFLHYLVNNSIKTLSELTCEVMEQFLKTLSSRYSSYGRSNILYTVRDFFKCPGVAAQLHKFVDFPILKIFTNKHEQVPSYFSREEVATVLQCINRDSKNGKREYAILLLAAQIGLRGSDIKILKLNAIDWVGEWITFTQTKTGIQVKLPLYYNVKIALADYIKNARPNVDFQEIFITSKAPFLPYGVENHLSLNLKKHFTEGKIDISKRHHGLHAFRHSLATHMLQDKLPAPTIAYTLGHSSIDSTKPYLRMNIELLRTVSLEVPSYAN